MGRACGIHGWRKYKSFAWEAWRETTEDLDIVDEKKTLK
jgi:hypothetical protein